MVRSREFNRVSTGTKWRLLAVVVLCVIALVHWPFLISGLETEGATVAGDVAVIIVVSVIAVSIHSLAAMFIYRTQRLISVSGVIFGGVAGMYWLSIGGAFGTAGLIGAVILVLLSLAPDKSRFPQAQL